MSCSAVTYDFLAVSLNVFVLRMIRTIDASVYAELKDTKGAKERFVARFFFYCFAKIFHLNQEGSQKDKLFCGGL